MAGHQGVIEELAQPICQRGPQISPSFVSLFLSPNFYDTVNSSKAKQCLEIPEGWLSEPIQSSGLQATFLVHICQASEPKKIYGREASRAGRRNMSPSQCSDSNIYHPVIPGPSVEMTGSNASGLRRPLGSALQLRTLGRKC